MKRLLAAILLAAAAGAATAGELKPYTGSGTPALKLQDLAGRTHDLKDYRGKVVLVNFWATWCPPCREEMPSMARLQQKLAGRPFAILAVDVGEGEEPIRDFLRQMKLDFTVLLDRESRAVREWKAYALPVSYLVDPAGVTRYGVVGGLEWDEPKVVKLISELMAPPQSTASRD